MSQRLILLWLLCAGACQASPSSHNKGDGDSVLDAAEVPSGGRTADDGDAADNPDADTPSVATIETTHDDRGPSAGMLGGIPDQSSDSLDNPQTPAEDAAEPLPEDGDTATTDGDSAQNGDDSEAESPDATPENTVVPATDETPALSPEELSAEAAAPVRLTATVQFDPPPGGFSEPFALNLSADAPNAQVRYTLDGSLPTQYSTVASGPISIDRTTMVRALAFVDDERGPTTNAGYFYLADSVREFRSNLPVAIIDMQGGKPPDPGVRTYVEAMIGVFEPHEGESVLASPADWTSRIGIRIRGRSSRYLDKPNYTMELWGKLEEDAPAPLMSLPTDGDWVLYAPYTPDPTLMRNALSYELSRRIGRYAPRTQFCEVFLAAPGGQVTRANYRGIYVLTERIQRSPERVDITKMSDSDRLEPQLTGGYIVQRNPPDPNDKSFGVDGERFLYVYPNDNNIVAEQQVYIDRYMEAAMRAVSAADGYDPTTGVHYEALIDVPSFIDHHILNILIKNPDAFEVSSYFFKDRDGRLHAGPVWDLDLGSGATDRWGVTNRSLDPSGWNPLTDNSKFAVSYWRGLFTHEAFVSAYWARFSEVLAGPLQVSAIHRIIDEHQQVLTAAELRNRERWPEAGPRDDSYPAETGALREWFSQRIAWIEANIGTLPPPTSPIGLDPEASAP